MKRLQRYLQSALAAGLLFPAVAGLRAQTYRLTGTMHLGGTGNWDYLIEDPAHHLLFSPRSTHTMVINEDGKVVADIPGLKHGHGVALVPALGRGFISDGDLGLVQIFDLKTYAVLGTVKAEDDADGIVYDPSSKKVFVVSGDGGDVIPFSPDLDPSTGKADEPIKLGGKPEYLVADGQGKVFINLTDKDQVAVLDTGSMKIVDRWSTAPGGAPVSMAFDREHRRLVIGCRKPQKMIVMSADDGRIVGSMDIGAGADASRYDPDGDAFTSCRDGSLAVGRETAPGHWEVVQTVKTMPWAGTMALDPNTHTVYLPTAKFDKPTTIKSHPPAIPDSFEILVVTRGE